jgi:hypothetical protein
LVGRNVLCRRLDAPHRSTPSNAKNGGLTRVECWRRSTARSRVLRVLRGLTPNGEVSWSLKCADCGPTAEYLARERITARRGAQGRRGNTRRDIHGRKTPNRSSKEGVRTAESFCPRVGTLVSIIAQHYEQGPGARQRPFACHKPKCERSGGAMFGVYKAGRRPMAWFDEPRRGNVDVPPQGYIFSEASPRLRTGGR